MKAVPRLSAEAWGDKVRRARPVARRWPKVAIWHGDADTTVAPGAADALVAQWTDIHRVGGAQEIETASPRHRLTRWKDASGEVLVEAHRLAGLGHGVPIAAGGVDGCGAAAPWVLEAGVSSSLEMARAWKLDGVRRATAPRRAEPQAGAQARPARPGPLPVDLNAVISRALKSAGLLG
jgi:poly(3-hydroxybutyrate) depolymerase